MDSHSPLSRRRSSRRPCPRAEAGAPLEGANAFDTAAGPWRIGNSNHPSGPSLPTTPVRLTGLMLSPSLGAAWFAWQIGPPVGFCAEPRPLPGRQISVPRRPQTAHAAARSIRDKRAPTGSLTRQRNRDSSSCSQQPGLYRRPPRPERQLALILLRRCTLQVRQYLRYELRLLDAGDDLQLATAARAALDLYTEHSLQPSCPAHRHMPGRRRLDRISPRHRRRRCTPAPLRRTTSSRRSL